MSVEEALNQIMVDNGDEIHESEESRDGTSVERYKLDDLMLVVHIELCLKTFNSLDLGSNLAVFKKSVGSFIKGSYHAFKPPSDTMLVLLNTSLKCGTLFATEGKQWLQKISSGYQEKRA